MNDKPNLLSRDNSMILRGVAIMFIMLHNFLHVSQFGFSGENEMSFSAEKASDFFYVISNGLGANLLGEFLSHLGWIGVPVFVFLTGYGVALKSPIVKKDRLTYIKRNYLKLLALMLPAVLFFAGIDIFKGDIWPGLLKRFSYLAMVTNFAYPFLNCNPGVYWYFGLTFQFYLLWAIFGKRLNGRNLLIWSIVLLGALYGISALCSSEVMSIFRHCFTGWFPIFALGVWLGKMKNDEILKPKSLWVELLLLLLLLGLILLMGRWMMTWIFIPIVALVWFIVIGMLLIRTRYLSNVFRWIGKYSACIFVCHPIARLIVLNTIHHYYSNVLFNVFVYVALTVVVALVYNIVYQWLLKKMLSQTA